MISVLITAIAQIFGHHPQFSTTLWFCVFQYLLKEKKEEIWLSPMTKTPTLKEKSKKERDNTKTPPKLRLHNDCEPN